LEREVAPLLDHLRRGETVELIRPGGSVPAHRVCLGQGVTTMKMTEKGLVISANLDTIVELIPSVPIPDYRIEAELIHDHHAFASLGARGAGILFARGEQDDALTRSQIVSVTTFDDWEHVTLDGPAGTTDDLSLLRFEIRRYYQASATGPPPAGVDTVAPFQKLTYPACGKDKPCRQLSVEVSPQGAVVMWAGPPALRSNASSVAELSEVRAEARSP
jgi:hypothetical protein